MWNNKHTERGAWSLKIRLPWTNFKFSRDNGDWTAIIFINQWIFFGKNTDQELKSPAHGGLAGRSGSNCPFWAPGPDAMVRNVKTPPDQASSSRRHYHGGAKFLHVLLISTLLVLISHWDPMARHCISCPVNSLTPPIPSAPSREHDLRGFGARNGGSHILRALKLWSETGNNSARSQFSAEKLEKLGRRVRDGVKTLGPEHEDTDYLAMVAITLLNTDNNSSYAKAIELYRQVPWKQSVKQCFWGHIQTEHWKKALKVLLKGMLPNDI